jgi:hypothetical protein
MGAGLGEGNSRGGREGLGYRFAAAWVRFRAAFGESSSLLTVKTFGDGSSCVLRETILSYNLRVVRGPRLVRAFLYYLSLHQSNLLSKNIFLCLLW